MILTADLFVSGGARVAAASAQVRVRAVAEAAFALGKLLAGMVAYPRLTLGRIRGPPP